VAEKQRPVLRVEFNDMERAKGAIEDAVNAVIGPRPGAMAVMSAINAE